MGSGVWGLGFRIWTSGFLFQGFGVQAVLGVFGALAASLQISEELAEGRQALISSLKVREYLQLTELESKYEEQYSSY